MDTSRFEQYARVAGIAFLVIACFLIVRPFLAAILFAAVLCLSTWPAYRWVRDRLGGRNTVTALLFVLAMLLAIALPVALAGFSLVTHSAQAIDFVKGFIDRGPFEPPAWLTGLPVIGASIDEYWHSLVGNREELVALARRLAEPAKGLLVAAGSADGEGVLYILLAIFMAFFFYRDGEAAGRMLRDGMARLAGGEQGAAVIQTAHSAVKGVVYGLIGTALAQAAVALVGFLVARRARRHGAFRAHLRPLLHSHGAGDPLGRRGGVALLRRGDGVGDLHGRLRLLRDQFRGQLHQAS